LLISSATAAALVFVRACVCLAWVSLVGLVCYSGYHGGFGSLAILPHTHTVGEIMRVWCAV